MRFVLPTLLLAAAVASPAAAEPFAHGAPSGTYVQFYDPRTGVPVGGPVAVSEHEFAVRAATVPADAPVIRVRPAPTVTDLGVEPVARRHRVVRPYVYGAHHAGRVYAPGPRIYGPRFGYAARVRQPIYVGPRRFAPAPFRYGRPVPGYEVVRARRIGAHYRGPRNPHRFGPPAHHRMGPPPGHRMGAARPGPRGSAPRPPGRPPFGGH